MLLFLATMALAVTCPSSPELLDPDGEVTVLAQNLKFIATGGQRAERASLLASYLSGEGEAVDLLLLSEARLTRRLQEYGADWCFYTQVGNGLLDGYRWAPIEAGRPPGGLALGVRQRPWGRRWDLGQTAGKRFRARPTSLAEGLLGRIVRYHKGWARLEVGDTLIVWSHAQASYARRPDVGAGRQGRGRAGQFEELASALGRLDKPAIVTGDLNLLTGFASPLEEHEAKVARAREIDAGTVKRFREATGLDLEWFRPKGRGTFAGSYLTDEAEKPWDLGALYDRVGVNQPFLARHPGTRVKTVEISEGPIRVSDHLGLEIAIPLSPAR